MTKDKKFDMLNSIKVLVTPWEKGFTCGIVMDSKATMSTEQYELCSTVARGMIKMATSDPHTTFLYGLRGFADDKKNNKGVHSKSKTSSNKNSKNYKKTYKGQGR